MGPLLSPLGLGDNGGPTQTIALAAGSAAIDAIPAGTNGCGAVEREALAFTFTGCFAPVDNLPTINLVKAGSAVPVKFSLGGDYGLDVLAGSPTAPAITCTPGNPTDNLTEVVAAANSGLQFDAATLTYTYVWRLTRRSPTRDASFRSRSGTAACIKRGSSSANRTLHLRRMGGLIYAR